MPKDFEECRRRGGKIRRVSGPSEEHGLDENEWVNYCTINGRSIRGEVKTKKEKADGRE